MKYTDQSALTKVAIHLLNQNERAYGYDMCQYRAKQNDGRILKCAVGALIPDYKYRASMEGHGLSIIKAQISALQNVSYDLLFGLQTAE